MLRQLVATLILVLLPTLCAAAMYLPDTNNLKEARIEARAEADLNAQQDMSKWAKLTLVVSAVGTAISAGGVIGLIITIRQTRIALDEARAGNALTEENYRIDTRPWIIVKNMVIGQMRTETTTHGIQISVTGSMKVQNIGKTPAQRLYCQYTAHPDKVVETNAEAETSAISLAPNEIYEDHFELVELIEDEAIVSAGEKIVADIIANVFYEDFTGVSNHFTEWQNFIVDARTSEQIRFNRLTDQSWQVTSGDGAHLDMS
ncbi:hypothetical protein [Pararhizobium qamdonense]|uniref:hypothetical protein n=1 Tax=Pararhizobium qamdonense TaxID=3031126 RepID=UPI0023E23BA1|nr:hypothetical protein [Pararhizobium qamdonense]